MKVTLDQAPLELPAEVHERVRALCLALPEVTVRVDEARAAARSTAWSYDIRRRSFCLLVAVRGHGGRPAPRLVLRVDPDERDVLASVGHPYFCPRAGHLHHDRIGVWLDGDTDWEEVGGMVTDSYRRLAPKKLIALIEDASPCLDTLSEQRVPSDHDDGRGEG